MQGYCCWNLSEYYTSQESDNIMYSVHRSASEEVAHIFPQHVITVCTPPDMGE